MLFAPAVFAVPMATAAEQKRPDFNTVGNAVVGYFRTIPDFHRGDLVSQRQVSAALAVVEATGWKIPKSEQIIARALPDSSFLLQQSLKPHGKSFMRKVASFPGGYPRLDRLATISSGQKLIRDLIRIQDGDVMIQYLATTDGGRELGAMMAQTPNGVDLNKPTGRIYTIDDLLQALAELYTGKPLLSPSQN
jgi:hypothetical protein